MPVPIPLLRKYSLFPSSGIASHVSVFLTSLDSGVTPFDEEGLHGLFAIAFRASLFRSIATGPPMPTNVTWNFQMMLSYA